jgi:hypothetical protein
MIGPPAYRRPSVPSPHGTVPCQGLTPQPVLARLDEEDWFPVPGTAGGVHPVRVVVLGLPWYTPPASLSSKLIIERLHRKSVHSTAGASRQDIRPELLVPACNGGGLLPFSMQNATCPMLDQHPRQVACHPEDEFSSAYRALSPDAFRSQA